MKVSIEEKFIYLLLAALTIACLAAVASFNNKLNSEQVDVDLINEMYHDRDIGSVERNLDENFKWDLRVEFVDGDVVFFELDCGDDKKTVENCSLIELE